MANTTLNKTTNELTKRVLGEFYGPYVIQNDGRVVPAGDLVTEEYTIYPKSVGSFFGASGRLYMRPDTVYGPKLFRPIIHTIRERPLRNYWDLLKSIVADPSEISLPYLKYNTPQ